MEWDEYFLSICEAVAKNSKCLSRKIGGLLVEDKRILCTGYNGPPSGVPVCSERYFIDDNLMQELGKRGIKKERGKDYSTICPRYLLGYKSGEGLEWCVAGHAERNLLITAARFGVATKGKSMYLSCGIPCKECTIEIINAGIKEVVVNGMVDYDSKAQYLLDHSDLVVRKYVHLKGD